MRLLCLDQGPFGKLSGCFMEAGKERLARDTVRDATRQDIEHHDGRTTTEAACCRPFPGDPPLQKNGHPSFRRGRRRMSAQERSNVITRVEETRWGKRRLLAQLQVPRTPITGGGPVKCKGSKIALATVPGFPGISLAHRKRPQYWRRPGSLQSGVAGNWPPGSQTT